MRNFENIDWKDFYLTEFFCPEKGNQNNMASLAVGHIPLVSAKKCDNGYKDFVMPNRKKLFQGNIITLNNDGDGGAGIAYYQPYTMALDSHVTALIPLTPLSRYVLLFVAMCITKQRNRFGHGYSLNSNRLRSFKLMLPLNKEATAPDWQFMEDYMKQKEQQILKPTIDKLCKQLITNNIIGGKLSHYQWKAFDFTDVFTEIQRGKRLKKADHQDGNTPYVSSTSLNNGVNCFIGNSSGIGIKIFSDCITIANSDSVGSAFFHKYSFVASDHVTQLKRNGLDKYAYLFMLPIISRLSEKYSFNREINDERIKREKLMLPINDDGDIDFAFMSAFMRDVEKDILGTTLRTFENRLNVNESKMGGRWKNYILRDLFPILVAGKSKGLNHIEKSDSGISYLGATNQNNGVLCFVEPNANAIQKGNCIAFVRNGEGSMGYSVYKAENFIATSDMTLGYNQYLNKYNGTFITTIADRIRGKYNFGYKRSAGRLAKEVLTLPADNNGNPNWEYMEQYMRNIESKQIYAYLKCITTKRER